MSYRLLFIVLLVIAIIVMVLYNNWYPNNRGGMCMNQNQEGFDCATENDFVNIPVNTESVIKEYIQYFVDIKSNRCLTDLSTYDYCNKIDNNRIIDIGLKRTISSEIEFNIMKDQINVLTKLYDAINEFQISDTANPFKSFGTDATVQPKPCLYYTNILDNFNIYYVTPSNYKSPDLIKYYSVMRYFFDIQDTITGTIYTGLGNYSGPYDPNYYDKFIDPTIKIYVAPEEIKTETVNLINPNYNYHLNYFSQYLLLNANPAGSERTNVNKSYILSFLIKLAHVLRSNLQIVSLYKTVGTYDIDTNPFPGKQTNINNDMNKIIQKVRSKTFINYLDSSNNSCSGSTLTKDALNVLNNIPDRKYFVVYLNAVKNAIITPDQTEFDRVDNLSNWDPTNQIINRDLVNNMILTDPFLLDTDPKHIYDLMEQFGHFDKQSNVYKLNQIGMLIIKKLSVDQQTCVIDYLDRMCILAFTPVKYGGEVNYDRWMFYT